MQLKLSTLTLVNFKGIRSITINFGDETSIHGANATGKSTIVDAWAWLLFGKNANDQKDFEIKTLDEHNQVISRIDHEVLAEILIDGIVTNLRRVYKEKWVKKHGESEQVFSGHETLYFVNNVPKSQSEYQSFINSIIPESTFKLLTFPAYFNSIKKEDRRAMLTGIATVPSDDELAGTDLADILSIMRTERKTLSDLKKQYSSQKAIIKAALEQIPARIDEVKRSTPEEQDFAKIENKIDEVKAAIKNCDDQIADKSKGVEEQIKIRLNIVRMKGELNDRLNSLTLEARKKVSEASGNRQNDISLINQNIRFKQNRIQDLNGEITRINGLIEYLNNTNVKLRSDVAEINSKVFDSSSITTTCPTCKQELPAGDINSKIEQMSANFNKDKADKIAEINRKGVSNNETIANHRNAIDNLLKQIEGLKAEITTLEVQLKEIESTTVVVLTVDDLLAANPEYIKTKAEIEALIVPEVEEVDTTELKTVKSDLQSELESLQRLLTTKDTIKTQKAREQELLKEESTLAQSLSEMEGFEFKITEFSNRKMKAVEDSVNTMFPNVRFKMFEVQINGGIAETCDTLINGVPYSDCNNAGRINAGLEIISVFSKLMNTYVPAWVDNAESVLHTFAIDSQIIRLYVTTDKVLKVIS